MMRRRRKSDDDKEENEDVQNKRWRVNTGGVSVYTNPLIKDRGYGSKVKAAR